MNNYLYYFNINNLSEDNYKKCFDIVSDYRKDKINKYRNQTDKILSLCSELLIRNALNKLNICSNYNFSFNKHGKPYLEDTNIFFNISHCKDYVICSISENEIGCDIEYIKEPNYKISERYFSKEEYEDINSSNNQNIKIDKFYRYWALKESFIKNIGLGLSLPLNSFCINLDSLSIKQDFDNNKYCFEEIDLDSNYKCSICKQNSENTKIIEVEEEELVNL